MKDGRGEGKKRRALAGVKRRGEEGRRYMLHLYIAGLTDRSATAVSNLKAICESHLKGRYELEVVDIYQQPGLAQAEDVTAVPMVVRRLPPPLRRIIGDLSKEERVLVGLGITPRT